MSWYESSFRKLFFDFHTHSTSVEVAKYFNAEAWAEQLSKSNVQAVSTFAQDMYGWRYYRKGNVGWIHPKLPRNVDIVGETIEACHNKGIRVIAYYNTLGLEIVQKRPDWSEVDIEGKSLGYLCLVGPALEEFILPELEELSRNYDIDGIFFDFAHARGQCFCYSCKKKFKEETGLDLPISSKDKNWKTFIEWKLNTFKEIRKRICNVVHSNRPNALIAFNWCYSTRQPENPPKEVGFLTLDIPPDNQAFNASLQARFWATLGKPFDIMNTVFLQWWQDWSVKLRTS